MAARLKEGHWEQGLASWIHVRVPFRLLGFGCLGCRVSGVRVYGLEVWGLQKSRF